MEEKTVADTRILDLAIQSIASSGSGVGFIDEEGFTRPVFVRYTVPGDVVRAQVSRRYKRYYEASLVEILTPSPQRVIPLCPHFGVCGACDFLHMSYEQQLRSKEALLRQALERSGLTIEHVMIVQADHPLRYRAKVRVFSRDGVVGFSARKSNEVVPIAHCDIVREELNAVFGEQSLPRGEHAFAYDERSARITDSECFYTVEDCVLAFHPKGFVQSNLGMNARLVRLVLSLIPKGTVLDLYAGNGNFSVPLAKRGDAVVAVEGDARGYSLLRSNALANGVTIAAHREDVKDYLRANQITQASVLLDPPRTGAADVIACLGAAAQTIVYVSCDARTLSKDLASLCAGGYTISSVHMIDMFPQTRHVETVVCLRKDGSAQNSI
ncbi:MAG: RsmD family RNA methyltransferase [Nanoarchaeota archaeon]